MSNEHYLEYSPKQKAFHIGTMKDIIDQNISLLTRKIDNSYLIIAGPGTIQQMQKRKIYFEAEFGRL